MSCVALTEPDDPDTWNDNYFCSTDDVGMVWSNSGAVDGMRCTPVEEPNDTELDAWSDDFICLPEDSAYEFVWSDVGPIDGMDCVRWYESREATQGWDDNYLCVHPAPAPPPDADGGTEFMAGGDAGGGWSHPDASIAQDASIAPDGGPKPLSGGCACRVEPRRSSGDGAILLLLAGLGWIAGRRRRRAG